MDKQGHRVTLPQFKTSSESEHHPYGQAYGQKFVPTQAQLGTHGLSLSDLGADDMGVNSSPISIAAEETATQEIATQETATQEKVREKSESIRSDHAPDVLVEETATGRSSGHLPTEPTSAAIVPSTSPQPQQPSPQHYSSEAIAPPKRLRPKHRKQRRRSSKLWPTLGFLGLMVFSGLGFAAYQWLTWLPPDPDCQNPQFFVSESDQLYCAQQTAQDGDIEAVLAGIDLTADWGPEHPMYRKSQEALTEWSAVVIDYAKLSLEEDGLEAAIAFLNRIPSHSSRYDEAQTLLTQWQDQWNEAEQIYQQAIAAIEQQEWSQASEHLTALKQVSQPHWSGDRAQDLSVRIQDEKAARGHFMEAMTLAQSGRSEDVSAAVSIMQSIQPETLAWKDAQGVIKQWGRTLIAAGFEALQAGNIDTALGHVQHLPIEIADEGEPKNLLRFSHAKQLTTFERVPWEVAPTEALQLSEAIATARPIPSDSQLYSLAQEAIAQWQRERDNVNQLQVAQWLARMGSRQTLELAIHQAQQIGINEPRRLQAQTLIAHWTQEVNNIQYRPQLAMARRMAAAETKDAIQSAIAHVQAVGVDPVQWPASEQWLSLWTQQLQAIEDRPILIEARELAASGDWEEAIERANEISAERSLYTIAQDHIEEWQSEFQLERNRAYLAEARSLASRIYLTQAIARASLIERGQPLYDEAQGLISQWVSQRERIRRQQSSQGNSNDSQSSPNRSSRQNSYEGYYDSRYYDYHR
ncbi:MAG: hypothetical protein VKL39_11405 [Leptolyngbyaceae bacterium]|nr:hypothetical protein [Leptolyngbyaceae bacterium]